MRMRPSQIIEIDMSEPQLDLLRKLKEGGVVDRYGRIMVQGVIVCRQTEAALPLRLVAKGLIEGHEDHLYPTTKALHILAEIDHG